MSVLRTAARRAVPLGVTLGVAVGLVVASTSPANAAPGAPAVPAKPAPAQVPSTVNQGCTLSPSLTHPDKDRASCLGVGAQLSVVPALGQTATLTVTVRAGRSEPATAVTVDLPTTLAFADGTRAAAAVTGAGASTRATIATVDLTAGQTRTFTRTVKAVATGFGEIAAGASAKLSDTRTDGGLDTVHLTVGADAASTHAGGTGDAAVAAAQPTAATPAGASVAAAPSRPSTPLATAAVPGQVPASPAAAGTSCVTGNWYFTDQNGVLTGAYQTRVEVVRGSTVVAQTYALGSGAYSACWSTGGAAQTVFVRFNENNNAWTLVNTAGNASYSYTSGTQTIADGATGNFGGLQPSDSSQWRGLHAYYDAAVEYDWIYQSVPFRSTCWSPFAASCFVLVIHWQSDSTTGAYFNSSGVYLRAENPDSEDVPVHEYGHALMYGVYGNTLPATTNCNPHFLFGASSTTCAWVEGFADWVDTSVWGNTVYTFSPGSTQDFNVTWNEGLGYDTGDQVEGRVVQALDSLNDGVKYPFDNDAGEGFGYRDASRTLYVMRDHTPSTFAAFWSGRGAEGYDTGQTALSALYQGTIDYGFRNPLSPYVGKTLPQANPPHNYSLTTTSSYWSAVAVKPASGSDVDVTLYNDAGLGTVLGSSGYGGTATDFVAINSNSGARPLQTYYPRVTQFAGTGTYVVMSAQGSSTLTSGVATSALSTVQPLQIWDSFQTTGTTAYYRAVPASGQSVQLLGTQAGTTIVSRSSSVAGTDAGAGQPSTLALVPSATGWGSIILLNNGSGSTTVYADRTAPTGTVSINGGAATTANPNVTLTLSGTDSDTGVDAMQISTDGTFDTEPVVPYATTGTATLSGDNSAKTVYVRYRNNAGMWSDAVTDTIKLRAAPSIDSVTPASGPLAGGTSITITGVRLFGATAVTVGGVAVSTFSVASDKKITAKVPAGTAGVKSVRVTTAYGNSAASSAARFTYFATPTVTAVTPSSGPAAGGTTVTVTGTNFTGTTSVKFGTVSATFTVVSATKITTTAPAGTGAVNIRITNPGGVSAIATATRFTYT